jgi:acyl-CoA synthetase (AMP-forming)/AMP-acid ligase II
VAVYSGIIEGPKLAATVPAVTVPELVREQARRNPLASAVIDGPSGRSYTYGELNHAIGRFAAGLAANGFKPGDTLLMLAPNLPEWPIAALGAMAAGGVVSGANPMCNAADLAHQLHDSDARFVFTVPSSLATVRQAVGAVGCTKVILLGHAEGCLNFNSLLACADPEPVIESDPDCVAALPYSSGTTGMAKGVMLTHRNIVANIRQTGETMDHAETRILLAYLPMFHIYGLSIVMLGGLSIGATLVTLPRFEPESFLKALQDHRVALLHTVPPVLQFLATHPLVDAHDLSCLKRIICGAAPLGCGMERRAAERLKCEVAQGFGMTESSGVVATSYPGRGRPGASGQLLPGTEARVVDLETGIDAERGSWGEIWFRGPQAFKGYLNRAEETAATITPDGWVRTGDIGLIDVEGYLYITDRLKELIKVKGFQVPPAELEALLLNHPSVADAAVIGRPDERTGETPVAYIRARGELDPEELKSWIAARVVEYKRLGDIVLCEAIPKTASGKILRRTLRAQDAERSTTVRRAGATGPLTD